jgi:hypothetical protein
MSTTATDPAWTAFTIIEHAADMRFAPLDDDETMDAAGLTARQIKILSYYEGKGYAAWRLEDTTATEPGVWATLLDWDEDGIRILQVDLNGVEMISATLPATPAGARWLDRILVPGA